MGLGRILRNCLLSLFTLYLLSAIPSAGRAEEARVALVIGNSRYEHVSQLPNTSNDAQDLSMALERIGFDVTQYSDLDYRDMRLAIRDFAEAAADADVVVVYFAGHGMEIDNTNYLIPVNAELKSDRDVDLEAIRLDTVIGAISHGPGLKIVLLDACRNNPFLTTMARTSATRSVGRGLARVDPGGVLVGYAARSGTLASDGDGRNSPYAQALLSHIEEPGLELGKMFRKVRDTVFDLTDGYQEPFTYGSLPGKDIFLVPAVAVPETNGTFQRSEILRAFLDADAKGTEAAWHSFLTRFSDRNDEEDLLDRARQKLTDLSAKNARAIEGKGIIGPDVVSRACDVHAADPTDGNRPAGIPGVLAKNLEPETAISICKRAISRNPDHGRNFYNLYRAYLAAGMAEEAVLALAGASELKYPAAQALTGHQGNQATKAALRRSDPDPDATEAALKLSLSDRKRVQTQLSELGFDAGVSDGQLGPRTRTALRNFQKYAGLRETGYLSEQAMNRLSEAFDEAPVNLDGTYLITVRRRWDEKTGEPPVDGPWDGLRTNMQAAVKVERVGTKLVLREGTDFSSFEGPWFNDFVGALSDEGVFSASFTINGTRGRAVPFRLSFSRNVGPRSLAARDIEFELGYFDRSSGMLIHVTIRRLE